MPKSRKGRNTCPDEEGTETKKQEYRYLKHRAVETHAPMKRGLKRRMANTDPRTHSSVETHAPMKRGLLV